MGNSLEILDQLISYDSITPANNNITMFLNDFLLAKGFTTFLIESVNGLNIYAEKGNGKNICFAGHSDVVTIGNGWNTDPFKMTIKDSNVYGRGVVDMKGAIAAALSIIDQINFDQQKISFMIASDEEHTHNYGTLAILDFLVKNKLHCDYVIVGEPTNPNQMGEMIKIGRRGSISFDLELIGKQGHVAYPENAINVAKLSGILVHELYALYLDNGNEFFSPSNLEVTNIEINNKSKNVIPGNARISFNIRYNNLYDEHRMIEIINQCVENIINKFVGAKYVLHANNSADPFLTNNQILVDAARKAVLTNCGKEPILSTTGGTSDARFIYKHFPVIEYGLINKTAHQIDEHVEISALENLQSTYLGIINILSFT